MQTTHTQQKAKKFIKKISRTGPNGTFNGEVHVHLGIRMEPNPKPNVHNPELYFRGVHVVTGHAEELTYRSPEFFLVDDAVSQGRKIEILVTAALEKMATEPQREKEPIEQSLKSLGYE